MVDCRSLIMFSLKSELHHRCGGINTKPTAPCSVWGLSMLLSIQWGVLECNLKESRVCRLPFLTGVDGNCPDRLNLNTTPT